MADFHETMLKVAGIMVVLILAIMLVTTTALSLAVFTEDASVECGEK